MAGFPLFRPSNITSGLVGYWKLDEASGSRADSSGNGNTLTDNNTVASVAQDYWKTGENSADFESGSSEYLSIADGSQTGLDFTADLTISGFIKLESGSTTQTIVSKGNPSAGTGWALRIDSSNRLEMNIGGSQTNSVSALSVGKWHHFAMAFNSTSNLIAYYIDGNCVAVVAESTNLADNAIDFRIGTQSNGVNYLDGLLKDIALHNSALTPIQIKSLALGVDLSNFAYRPNNVSTAPTSWWKLNELSGNRADSIGSLTLTDNNTVAAAGGYVEGVGADFEAGNSEYLSSADNTAFDFSGGIFSVSAWIKPESLTTCALYSHRTDGNNFFHLNLMSDGSLKIRVDSAGSTVVSVTTAAGLVKAGTLSHVAFTENGDTWKIYCDGVDVTSGGGSDTSRASNLTGDINIGKSIDLAGDGLYDGLMSDFAFWKGYALTDAEIKSLACGIPLQQTGIVSYWKLDETSGTRADSIGANNLTDNNTVLSGTGKVSNAADFEASNSEYLSIANGSQAGLNVTGELTLLCWFNREAAGASHTLFGMYDGASGDGDGAEGYYFRLGADNVMHPKFGTAGEKDMGAVASAGAFAHYSVFCDGASWKTFVNSALITNTAETAVNNANQDEFCLGRFATGDYADGLMDEALIAKRWFRDEEIKTIYCKGLAGKELTYSEIQLGGNQVIWTL